METSSNRGGLDLQAIVSLGSLIILSRLPRDVDHYFVLEVPPPFYGAGLVGLVHIRVRLLDLPTIVLSKGLGNHFARLVSAQEHVAAHGVLLPGED